MKILITIILTFCLLSSACRKDVSDNESLSEISNNNNELIDDQYQETEIPVIEGYPQSRVEAIEAEEQLLNQVKANTDVQTYRSFVSGRTRWTARQVVTVAFNGGSIDLRQKIEKAVKVWIDATNIKFDFRNPSQPDTFREWTIYDAAYRADIRIAFESYDEYGLYWSAIGNESTKDYCDPTSNARSCYFPNQSSMNLGGFTTNLPSDWEATVLHEFGHALGFLHEHQNPSGNCENEFNWDKVYEYYAQLSPPWGKPTVDFNLRKFPRRSDMEFSEIDPTSIMKYHFKRFMFKDINVSRNSRCYRELINTTLSTQDKIAVADAYPRSSADIQRVINERVNVSNKVLKIKNLPEKLKEEIKENIKVIKNQK